MDAFDFKNFITFLELCMFEFVTSVGILEYSRFTYSNVEIQCTSFMEKAVIQLC